MKQFLISNRKILIILAAALLAIGIPLLITIYQQSQETREHAATPNNRIRFAGSKWFLVGYDYPWNNYGYDFSNSSSNVHGQYRTVNDTLCNNTLMQPIPMDMLVYYSGALMVVIVHLITTGPNQC